MLILLNTDKATNSREKFFRYEIEFFEKIQILVVKWSKSFWY